MGKAGRRAEDTWSTFVTIFLATSWIFPIAEARRGFYLGDSHLLELKTKDLSGLRFS